MRNPTTTALASLWRAFSVHPPYGDAPVSVAPISGCGNGMVATADIACGQALLSIPLEAGLSVPRGSSDGRALAAALQNAVSAPGPWQDYRSLLMPERPVPAAMFWSEDELEELQHGDAIELARSMRRRHVDRTGGYGLRQSGAHDRWALSMVHSRSFHVDDGGRGIRALLPFADLFNHLPESPAEYRAAAEALGEDEPPSPWQLETDDERGAVVVLRAAQAVQRGEEVLLPYGAETNAELLTTHGFSLDAAGANSAQHLPLFDSFEELLTTLAPGLPAAQAQARRQLWSSLDASEAPLSARPGPGLGASSHVLGAAQLALAAEGEDGDDDVSAAFEEGYHDEAGHYVLRPAPSADAQLERSARLALAAAAREKLDAMLQRSSLEDDEQRLQQLQLQLQQEDDDDAQATERARLAVSHRLGVKRLLQTFASTCESLDGLRAQI